MSFSGVNGLQTSVYLIEFVVLMYLEIKIQTSVDNVCRSVMLIAFREMRPEIVVQKHCNDTV